MTVMFNQLHGNDRTKNSQMQIAVGGLYASLLTRITRKPRQSYEIHPKLIACPDWPVHKHDKMQLSEITTNDGMHYHGVLLTPPVSRLRIPVAQHFTENTDVYLCDPVLARLDVRPFNPSDVQDVVDYALKGLKTNRLPDEETLLILPKTHLEIQRRPYRLRIDL
jgi:hypothetical protein